MTDEYAALLLHTVAMPIIGMVHEGEIDEAARALDRCSVTQLRQLAVLLAAMVDPDTPADQALAWWTEPPGRIIPEHADEWAWDAPPLRRGHAVEALVEERHGPGRRR